MKILILNKHKKKQDTDLSLQHMKTQTNFLKNWINDFL